MRVLAILCLAFLAIGCDKTIHEVRFPANHPVATPDAPPPADSHG